MAAPRFRNFCDVTLTDTILRNLISCFIALLQVLLLNIQFNLFATVTLGTEESGYCREVAVVERLKQESMYGLSAKKMAIVERWPLLEVRLHCITFLSGLTAYPPVRNSVNQLTKNS